MDNRTPFSLIEFLRKGNYFMPQLENKLISSIALNSFDIEKIQLEVLLFQAGYLTIDKVIEKTRGIYYKLMVPNKEVQISLNSLLSEYLVQEVNPYLQDELYDSLYTGDIESFRQVLNSLFASIPYTNYVNNIISNYEGYYSSVIYTYLMALGIKIIAEDVTNKGRIDLTMFVGDKIYILEFKVGTESSALSQIKQKRYYEKYQSQSPNIYLIGINFDANQRNISNFEWEKM